jgi:hypothetical protein
MFSLPDPLLVAQGLFRIKSLVLPAARTLWCAVPVFSTQQVTMVCDGLRRQEDMRNKNAAQ